ncbi:hypothetical protein [Williamsia herbipolensis]|uniref:hypothetical protein n=1 Tax=Williamsia herbipolensis TaxID=1603258 RepID=UPI0005F79988|nr:hypothetical protein [Williamsia herbipolensis]
MRGRTHPPAPRTPAALLPATSAIATAVLASAWWLTMIGLTAPTLPHIGVAVTSAAFGAAVVAVASHPHVRSLLSRWVFRQITRGREVLPPGVSQRWARAHTAARTPASHELALVRVARPRAPGQGSVTA